MDERSAKRDVKQGRRAGNLFQAMHGSKASQNSSLDAPENKPQDLNGSLSPRPARRQGGWAEETQQKAKNDPDEESHVRDDERLKADSTASLDKDDDDIPVIPNLDDVIDDDASQLVAAPPSVQVNRVATYKELDSDFQKHAGIMTMDGDIDLKLLSSVLSPESEVIEEDKVWDWDRVFTEVTSDLLSEWDKGKLDE